MGYQEIITSTKIASSQAQQAAQHARQTQLGVPFSESKYKEELALSVANLAIAMNQLAQELKGKGMI